MLFMLFANTVNAQEADKTVTLVVTGQGKTPDEAKQSALRSAIEQAFGAFISSKTEILNDNLVKDEIVSVANGNIQKFEIISEVQIPNGGYATTLNAIVSVTKLTSFVESKGVVAEFKGSLLAANVKQQMLNEQNETKSLTNIVNQCKEILDMSCDFEIIRGEPKQKDGDNNKWAVPLTVNVKFNKNIEQFSQYFLNSVKGLCMSSSEIQQYKALAKETYKINIGNGGIGGETDNIEYLKLLAGEYDNLTYKIVLDTVLYSTDVLSDVIKGFKQITKSGLTDYYHRPYKIIYYEKSINSSYYFRNLSSVVSIIDLIYYTNHATLNFKITNGIDDINIEKMCAGYWEYRRYYRSDKKSYSFKIIDNKLTPIFNQGYSRYSIGNGPWKLTVTSADLTMPSAFSVWGTCGGVYSPIKEYNDRFLYIKRDDKLYGAVYRLKFGFLTQADYESAQLASLAVISLYDYKTSDENILTFTFEDVLSISELEKIKEYKINTISKN